MAIKKMIAGKIAVTAAELILGEAKSKNKSGGGKTSEKVYASLFDKLQAERSRRNIAFQSRASRQWFADRVKGLKLSSSQVLGDPALKPASQPSPDRFPEISGRMFTYLYNPKHKDTLPYYDRFPLVIMVGPAYKGFYGMNLHYLPLVLRIKFLDSLMSVTNNNKFDESTKFRINYGMLSRFSKLRYFKPCYKHYLTNHIQSRVKFVEATEWEVAAFLPTAKFRKASAGAVHADSRRLI